MYKTRTINNFRSFCLNCFSHIEIPLISSFEYGTLIFQTKDGQDFYVAELLNNSTFDFITTNLRQLNEFTSNKVDPQKVLVLLADKPNGKDFTLDYPICPICKKRNKRYNKNVRTTERLVGFVTWNSFENLTQDNKIIQLEEAITYLKA